MCGICGAVRSGESLPLNEPTLIAMRDSMEHRGPDDAGHYLAPGIALGSRRLAILDLSERGHMPMSTAGGRYWITYNGEVYNYRELRSWLEGKGHHFHSDTDTEVLLHLYIETGPAMLERLNGMFAIAIWDNQERTLFLARDRLGIKPLFYTRQQDALWFASEEKALFVAGATPDFDPAVWEELMCFRYVAGERTPYRGIQRLLPGHYLIWKDGNVTSRRWWNLGQRAVELREGDLKGKTSASTVTGWHQETLDSAVDMRRIGDVPVGVLLSGGLDSGSIAASLAMQAGSGVSSFVVRFEEENYDEGPLARQVADQYQLDYHELRVAPDELMSCLQIASRFNDEPLIHSSDLHIHAIARYAKPHVTILLSGEGGDETLGGYVRYQPLRHPRLLKIMRGTLPPLMPLMAALPLKGRTQKLNRFLALGSIDQFILFNSCDVLPGDLESLGMETSGGFPFREQVLSEAKRIYPDDPVRQVMYSDQHTFLCSLLDRNDRMSMGASIECRVPMLDYRLVEGLAALPTSVLLNGHQAKPLLRQSVGERLPQAILKHHKWGFGVPWRRYLRNVPELVALVDALPELQPICSGPFDTARLKKITEDFRQGEDQYAAIIIQLVMIAVWYQSCLLSSQQIRQGSNSND